MISEQESLLFINRKLEVKMSGNLFKDNDQIIWVSMLALELLDYFPISQ